MPTKNKRFMLCLDESYIKKLNDICSILQVKQYSKVLKVMIDTFLYINEDKVS